MSVPTGTFKTYEAIGIREDLQDLIYNVDPTEVPFMATIAGQGSMKDTFQSWQIDTLRAPDGANARLEGQDAAFQAIVPTTRPGNYSQISDETAIIAGTLEATDRAGREREMGYQLMKKSKELRRDCETILTGNQASSAGDAGNPRTLGSLEAWYTSNTQYGATGGDGGFSNGVANIVSARTDGTQRDLTEGMLKQAVRQAWVSGGDPTVAMCGAVQKQVISTFDGSAATTVGTEGTTAVGSDADKLRRNISTQDRSLVTGIDLYRHDYGALRVVPNRFSRDRTVHVLDPSLWSVIYLRPFASVEIARTGDSEKRLINVEYSLVSKNEKGSAIIADLNDS